MRRDQRSFAMMELNQSPSLYGGPVLPLAAPPATSLLATAQPELAPLPSQSRPGPAPSGMSPAVVVAGRMGFWSNRISPRWPPQPLGLDLE